MPTDVKILSEDSAIEKIVETVGKSEQGKAPFALVVGAGFSRGLVPITRDIVHKSLPRLDKSFVPNLLKPASTARTLWGFDKERRRQERHKDEEEKRRAISFWKKFAEENESKGLQIPLSVQGLPLDVQLAYKCAFDNRSVWPFANPADAHKFLHGIMRSDPPRLNAAHFFLASILGSQPSIVPKESVAKDKTFSLFKFQSAFSRLILTTNFDPFLQIALQYANRLYFMSDTPNLEGKDLSEDQTDAIHLVYLHGSIHRHAQAHTDEQIKQIKEMNAKVLAPILKGRAIIVIGYSGWDDVVVEALAACDKFEHGLYWLGLRTKPFVKGAFGLRVPEILEKPGACYVPIKGAGHFMNKLNTRLVYGLPLLDNPIAQLRQKLSRIDLQKLDDLEIGLAEISLNGVTQIAHNIVDKPTVKLAMEIVLQGLEIAEGAFFKQCEEGSIRHLKIQAGRANLCTERINFCDKALTIPNLSIAHQASFLELRSHAFFMSGKFDEGIADLTRIIETPHSPNKNVWQALLNRAMAFWQTEEKRDLVAALADLTRVVEEIPDTPDMPQDLKKLRMECLYCRGCILCDKEEYEKSISDLTSILDKYSYDSQDSIRILFSRACVFETMGQYENAVKDYSIILQSPYRAPCGQEFEARHHRARVFQKMRADEKAMADFTRAIETSNGVPANMIAEVFANRGWLYYMQNNFHSFLHDTETCLQKFPLDFAMYNLGLALLANERDAEAFAAYRRAAKQYPKSINELGLKALRDATNKWLAPERATPCIELLESSISANKAIN